MDQCNESLYFMPKSRAQKSKISLLSLARRGGRKTLGSEPRSGRPTCSLVRRSLARTADEIRNDFGADATVFTTTFSDFVFLVHGGRTTSKVRTAQAATPVRGCGRSSQPVSLIATTRLTPRQSIQDEKTESENPVVN